MNPSIFSRWSAHPGKLVATVLIIGSWAVIGYQLTHRHDPVQPASNPLLDGKSSVVLQGRVNVAADATASPQAATGARVVMVGKGFTGEALAESDGRFALRVPAPGTYSVLTSAAAAGEACGAMSAFVIAANPVTQALPTLVAHPTGSILGRVTLQGGRDAAGADVYIGGTQLVGKVGAAGRFALAGVPEGTWDLVVQKVGFEREVAQDLEVVRGKPLTLISPINLMPTSSGGALKVTVLDTQGAPLPGAVLTAEADGLPYGSACVPTDEHGEATLGSLPEGPVSWRVDRAGCVGSRPTSLNVAGHVVELGKVSLQADALTFGQIGGQALDREGTAIAAANARLVPPVAGAVQTDGQGGFSIDHVPAGDYTLIVEAARHTPAARGVHVVGTSLVTTSPLRLDDAFSETLSTTPDKFQPIDFNLGAKAARANNRAADAEPEPGYEATDTVLPGYTLRADLAAPTVWTGRDRAGHPLVQWLPIRQDPMPADASEQLVDLRYQLQYYQPGAGDISETPAADKGPRALHLGHGRWNDYVTYAKTSFQLDPSLLGFRYRLAVYANLGPDYVYGPWSYFVIGGESEQAP